MHLVDGIRDSDGKVAVHGFGEIYLDRIRVGHIEQWKADVGKLIQKQAVSLRRPRTRGSRILRTIMRAAKREFELPRLVTEGVTDFDLSTHVVYTEESPNALAPEQVPEFLNRMREMFPQHFAMVFLGFATGLRPSSLRPLRRSGPSADVQWDEGPDPRPTLANGPERGEGDHQAEGPVSDRGAAEVMKVLRWHVQTQLDTPEQQESELLFPSVKGSFRAVTSLCKPFAAVAKDIKLPFPFSPRGMRRTFNDLARASNVEAIVTRSISGHLTEEMQNHYSTVRGPEQRDGIARVVDLMTAPSEGAEWYSKWYSRRFGTPKVVLKSARRFTNWQDFWWAQQGSNLRLRPCEGRTLPLSYAPGCGRRAEARLRKRFLARGSGFRNRGRLIYVAALETDIRARRRDRWMGLLIVGTAFVAALSVSWWARGKAAPEEEGPPAPPTTEGVVGYPHAVDAIATLETARGMTKRADLRGIALYGVASNGMVDVSVPGHRIRFAFSSARGEGPQPPHPPGTLARHAFCGRQNIHVRPDGIVADPDQATAPCSPLGEPLPEPRCGPKEVWQVAVRHGVPTNRPANIDYFRSVAGPAWRFNQIGSAPFVLYGDCVRELTGRDVFGSVP